MIRRDTHVNRRQTIANNESAVSDAGTSLSGAEGKTYVCGGSKVDSKMTQERTVLAVSAPKKNQEELNSSLKIAVKANNCHKVKRLLLDGADANSDALLLMSLRN